VIDIPGSTSSTHPDVEIRHFSCPACGALLDSETALPEDPFLDDILNCK
jgi:acetone carboxylase gamma subunit